MNEYELTDFINEIPLDLRVEVVIADIISSGFNATDLFVRSSGIFERRFKKDIHHAEVVEFNNRQQAVFVNVHRESLYDGLPQAIFHNPPGKGAKAFKTSREMVDEYKQRLVEESEARKFFSAYEIEFYRQRIANEVQENNLIEAVSFSMNDAEILSYWKLPGLLDKRQKGILFYLVPVFNKIRRNTDYMQEILRMILQYPIKVTRDDDGSYHNFDDSSFTLGNIKLAVNSIVGNKIRYYYPVFNIEIGSLEGEKINDFLPGGINLKIIEKLNGFFIPLHCDAKINVITRKNLWKLNDEVKNESRLGYSLWI